MKRTQIYLDDTLKDALKRQSKIQGKKISQIIREILRKHLLTDSTKASSVSDLAGIWSDRDFNTEEYIRKIRSSRRLDRIYEER